MLEKKKEEMDGEVQKLHVKLKQEQQRWDRECVAREKQQVNRTELTELVFCFLKAITVIRVSRVKMRACWRSESNGASWRLNACAASESSWRPSCWSISKMWTG